MLERRPVDEAAAPPAWCERHDARLRVIAPGYETVLYECPVGGERIRDQVESVHVVEQRWKREEEPMDREDKAETPKPSSQAETPKSSDSTKASDAGGSQSPTSDGKPLPGQPETK